MSVNKVILIGNITRDAEVRVVGQSQVAQFGLATSESYTDNNGQKQEVTEFHNIEFFSKTGGVFQYLTKGQSVYVEGSIRTDKWTAQDGTQKSAVKIRANSVQLVGRRETTAPAQPQYQQGQYQPQQQMPQAPQYPPQQGYTQYPPQPQAPQQSYQQAPGYQMPFPQGN